MTRDEREHLKAVIRRNRRKDEQQLIQHLRNSFWDEQEIEYGVNYWRKLNA